MGATFYGDAFPKRAPNGSAAIPSYSFAGSTNVGMYLHDSSNIGFSIAGSIRANIGLDGGSLAGLYLGPTGVIGWDSANPVGGSPDLFLVRDGAAGTMAQKNGTNTQTFRVYTSTTGPIYVELKNVTANGHALNTVGTLPDMSFQANGVSAIFYNGSGVFSTGQNTSLHNTGNAPAQITANQNNYNPGTGGNHLLSANGAYNITGLAGGSDGRRVIIQNTSAFALSFTNEDAASTAANRFITGSGATRVLAAGQSIELIYDAGVASRWRILQ